MKTKIQIDQPGPLESHIAKDRCQMCGCLHKLEAAFDPSGKVKTLCQKCRIGSAKLLAAKREPAPSPMPLDRSDIATILAALRMFQKKYEDCDSSAIHADWPDHFADAPPLSTADIDILCEQINCSPDPVRPAVVVEGGAVQEVFYPTPDSVAEKPFTSIEFDLLDYDLFDPNDITEEIVLNTGITTRQNFDSTSKIICQSSTLSSKNTSMQPATVPTVPGMARNTTVPVQLKVIGRYSAEGSFAARDGVFHEVPIA